MTEPMRVTAEVEKCARAIARTHFGSTVDLDACYGYNCAGEFVPGGEGGETKPHAWEWCIPEALACMEALLEPTIEMQNAAHAGEDEVGAYRAMLLRAMGR